VREPRLRKDAFDAAEHLRKQPSDRIGLLGMSQSAMAALAASANDYDTPQGRRAFRAIVSIYLARFFANVQIPGRSGPVNLHYLPETKIVVPLLVPGITNRYCCPSFETATEPVIGRAFARPVGDLLRMRSNSLKHNNLMLRSERRERLEAWAVSDSQI
jgi:hypothetical protein